MTKNAARDEQSITADATPRRATPEATPRATATNNAGKSAERSPRVSRREMLKATAGIAIAAPLLTFGHEAAAQQRSGARRRNAQRSAPAQTKPTDAARAEAATKAPAPYAPRFFNAAEFALVDELTELIIPTDDHSLGARAAGVAAFIDKQLAEYDPQQPEYAKERDVWRNGLKLVEAFSQEMHQASFMQATEIQRIAVLTRMSQKEAQTKPAAPKEDVVNQDSGQSKTTLPLENKPKRPDLAFFDLLKAHTVRAYYTSEIGLHKELEYKDNQYLKQFVGYDAT